VDGTEDQRKVDDFIIFAMCAARQALETPNGTRPANKTVAPPGT